MNEAILERIGDMKYAIEMDLAFSRRLRHGIKNTLLFLCLASFIVSFFSSDQAFDGLALIFLGFFLFLLSLSFFYNASKASIENIDYSTALSLWVKDTDDATFNFLNSGPGQVLLFRLGIADEEVSKFINSNREILSLSSLVMREGHISFGDYAKIIYEGDKSFQTFLSGNGISEAELETTSNWIGEELNAEIEEERGWSKENLDKIASLGTSFDYGVSRRLTKYSVTIFGSPSFEGNYRQKEVKMLENILSRSEEANAIIVDDDESVAYDITSRLARKIRIGEVLPILEHREIQKLDWNVLVADRPSKNELEREVLSILDDATKAGNKIIYISDLPSFISNVKNIGVNLSSLMEDFMKSKNLHIVAHATKSDFHYLIENNAVLSRMFERILPDELGVEASLPLVIDKARRIEYKEKIFWTFPALLRVVDYADRYMPQGEMPGKAIDMLLEIVPWVKSKNIKVISKSHVAEFVSEKTGIAVGNVHKEEKDKLENLESILHERIVGQDEAVKAVANAMRRARSGLSNPKRPFATFLFLGPTGVGKTETSKALAKSFFGSEDKINRLNMPEYKDVDALPALIGSSASGTSGALSSMLRDNPYGVLLLDEFEKSSPDVRDLFLQILDEGEYIDALGNKVNCKNLIIIATSNAGSDLIWQMMEKGEDLNQNKDKIVDSLIENHIYKPELVNRFDGVIIFHPLGDEDMLEVAKKSFEALRERIKKDKQIEVSISGEALSKIVAGNTDKEFGARSINRLLQEKVEDLLAKKIISGEIVSGSKFEVSSEDVLT